MRFLGIIIIPDNAIGLVTKKFVVTGRNPGNYAAVQVAEAFSRATQRIGPEIVASGGGADGASGSLITSFSPICWWRSGKDGLMGGPKSK